MTSPPPNTAPLQAPSTAASGEQAETNDERVGANDERVGANDERVGANDERVEAADERAERMSEEPKEPTLDDLFRRQGFIAGWMIAWPFFLLTASAGVIAAAFQWMQRPQLVPFTVGLYLCMAFFAYAYSIAWRYEARVRQMLAMTATVTILVALIALHLDDGAERWVYRGDIRVLRPAQPLLRLAVALDVVAIIIMLGHGLGLGFGNRFFLRESGERVSRARVREILKRANKN